MPQLFADQINRIMLRRFRNPRKFISGLRKRIGRIFRPKIGVSRQDIDQKDGKTGVYLYNIFIYLLKI
jgi:hypothetical protein